MPPAPRFQSSPTQADNRNFGLFFILAIVAFGISIVSLIGVARQLINHYGHQAGSSAIAAVVSALIGIALLAAGVRLRTKWQKETALRKERPDEPWMWNLDWTGDTIGDRSRSTVNGLWVAAIFWNLFGTPAGIMAARDGFLHHKSAGWIGLLFPAAGVGLLVAALIQQARRSTFGSSSLKLTTMPGRIGRQLSGTITASDKLATASAGGQAVTVAITCTQVTRSQGRDSPTSVVLWNDEQSIAHVDRAMEPGRVNFPFSFSIPSTAQPTTPPGFSPRGRIFWRLEARATLPGPDYVASFDIPVFAPPQDDSGLPWLDPTEAAPDTAVPHIITPAKLHPDDPRIVVQYEAGGTRIEFPAARNLLGIAGAVAFGVLFGGLAWLSFHSSQLGILFVIGFHILLPALMGFIALCIAAGVFIALFKSQWVLIRHGTIQLGWRMLGLRGQSDIPAADVQKVETSIGSSTTIGSHTTATWEVELTAAGRTRTVARGMSKSDAEWVAEQLRSKTIKSI